jgi:hypothetical protein
MGALGRRELQFFAENGMVRDKERQKGRHCDEIYLMERERPSGSAEKGLFGHLSAA